MTFEEQLDRTGHLAFTSVGTSMLPLLRQNRDVVHICKTDTYRKRDAILFRRDNGQYILHRIQQIYPAGCYVVGDNCIEGEMVRPDQILGVLVAVVRDGETIPAKGTKHRLYVHTRPVHRLYLRLRRFCRRYKHLLRQKLHCR